MASITDISATPTPTPEDRLVALHEGYEHQTATILVASPDTRNPYIDEKIRELQDQVNLLVSSVPDITPDDNPKVANTAVTPIVPAQHEVTPSVSDPDTRHTTPETNPDTQHSSTSRCSSVTLVDRPSPPVCPSGVPPLTNDARASAPSPSPTLAAFMASSSSTPNPPSSTPEPSPASPATSRPTRKLPARSSRKAQPQASYLATNPALAHIQPRAQKPPPSPSKEVSAKARARRYEEESDEEEEGKTYWGSKIGEYDMAALKEFADGRPTVILVDNAGYESEEMEVDEPKGKGKGRGKKGTKRGRDDENEQVQVDEQPAPVAEVKSGRRTKRAKVSPPEPAKAVKGRGKPKATAKPKAKTPATRVTTRATATRKRA